MTATADHMERVVWRWYKDHGFEPDASLRLVVSTGRLAEMFKRLMSYPGVRATNAKAQHIVRNRYVSPAASFK